MGWAVILSYHGLHSEGSGVPQVVELFDGQTGLTDYAKEKYSVHIATVGWNRNRPWQARSIEDHVATCLAPDFKSGLHQEPDHFGSSEGRQPVDH